MGHKGKYRCSSCGVGVELLIEASSPPIHDCKKRLNKPYELEKVEDAKTGNRKRRQDLPKEVS